MTHLISLILGLALSTSLFAQESVSTSTDANKAQPPLTKLEAFSARTGIVVIKAFTTIDTIVGTGQVSIDVREFRDASNPKIVQYGVAVEVKESSRLERTNSSYVDEDEIESLIKGLEYISKIDKSITTFSDFEAQFRTKGDLSMIVFSNSRGSLSLAVKSGRIGATTAYLNLSDAQKISTLLKTAREKINAAKQQKR